MDIKGLIQANQARMSINNETYRDYVQEQLAQQEEEYRRIEKELAEAQATRDIELARKEAEELELQKNDPQLYQEIQQQKKDAKDNKSLFEAIKESLSQWIYEAGQGMNVTGGIYNEADRADESGEGFLTSNRAFNIAKGNASMQAANYIAAQNRRAFFKDWKNQYARRLNDFQIGAFQGYIDRANQFKQLMDGVRRSYEIEEEIGDLQQSGDPNNEIPGLRREYDGLQETRDAFNSYLPNKLTAPIYQSIAGNGEDGWISNNSIFGRTGQLHDELNDITAFLSSINHPRRSNRERIGMIDAAYDRYNAKMKEWTRAIDDNIKDRESYGKVSDWFLTRANRAGTDFFDPNTYLFGMPGLLAGTTSGMTKTIPAMLLGVGTAGLLTAASVATGGLAAGLAAGAVAGIAGTFALNYGAGVDENNMEVAEAYSDQIKDYLNSQHLSGSNKTLYQQLIKEGREKLNDRSLSDEEIFEKFRKGDFYTDDVRIQKKMRELSIGIESMFQDDMAAVTWSSGLETMLQVAPIGRALGITKPLRRKLMRQAVRSEAAKKLLRSEMLSTAANDFKSGLQLASPVGILGQAVYAPLHTVVAPTIRSAGKFGMSLANKLGIMSRIATEIPKEALEQTLKKGTRNKFLKDIGGRFVTSTIAEGIEEGKQHYAQERYLNGEYDSPVIKGIFDTLLDDAVAGSKSALLIAGLPFEGLMSESDRRTLQEIKGGMLLGGHQTLIMNAAQSVAPYTREQNANNAVLQTVLQDKLRKIDLFNKAKIYAEKAKSGTSYQSVNEAFDRLRNENETRKEQSGEYEIKPEHIDEEQKQFEKVARIANDPYTIKQAEAQGIERGTQLFNEFVATKALADDELQSAVEVKKGTSSELKEGITTYTESILNQSFQDISSVVPGSKEVQNSDEANAQAKIIERTAGDYNNTLNVAQYVALLKRKIVLEAGLQNAIDKHRQRAASILREQLNNTNNQIKLFRSVIQKQLRPDRNLNLESIEDTESNLVLDKPNHDALSSLFYNDIVAGQDLELAQESYDRVVGEAYKDGKKIEDFSKINPEEDFESITFKRGYAKNVIDEIYATINDDEDLASAVQRDFEQRTDDYGNEIISPEQKQRVESTPPPSDPEQEFKQEIISASKKQYVTPTTQEIPTDSRILTQEIENKHTEAVQSPSEPVSSTEPTVVPETSGTSSEASKNGIVVTPDSKFDVDQLDFDNNYYVAHQTLSDNLEDIGRTGLNNSGGLNGTALFVNKESILTALQDMRNGKGHRGSDGLVLFAFPKSMFSGQIRHLDDISAELVDIVGPDALNVTPPSFISHLISVEQNQTEAQRAVINELNRRAQLSKTKVKKVTSEYYLIEVGDELIQMPRVHSVMPKYWMGDGSYAAALQLGNVFDNLARQFFGDIDNIALYEQNKGAFVEQWLNKPVSEDTENPNSLNKTYRDLYATKEAFADTIKDLYELAKQYRDLGWALSTDKIVWYSQFNSGWVAGETDMLAVDRDGNIHIIDFKTAKGLHPFETFLNDDLYRTTKYANLLNTLTEDDFSAGPKGKGLSKKAKAVKRKIREAEKIDEKPDKNIMLDWANGRAVLRYADSEYYKIPPRLQSFRSAPKSEEYSSQLTAYAEMIQKQLANVVDLEVVGFRTQYAADDNKNLQEISLLENEVGGKPFRIKVSFNDEMRSILNNEGVPVEQVTALNEEAVEATQNLQNVQQIQNQEQHSNDKIIPTKSEDSLLSPTEPAPKSHESLGYSNLNITFIKNDPELSEITASPDFINECLQYGLVEVYTDDKRSGNHHDVYVDITYNGKTYKGIHVWATQALYDKVKSLESNKNNQKVVATALKRTSGEIQYRKDGKSVPLTETSLLAGINLKEVELTYDNRTIGIVNNGNVIAYLNGDLTQPRPIFSFNTQKRSAPKDGTVIFVKNPNHKENPNEAVPVGLKRKTFKDSADFIIKCLTNFNSINDPCVITINGEPRSIGVSNRNVLSLLMPIVNNANDADGYSIMRDEQNPSVFRIVTRETPQGVASVNMLDPNSIESFKKFLEFAEIPLDKKTLVSRIGASLNNTPQVFKDIKRFFGQNANVQSLAITPDIRFDRSDILENGLSGLGWYIKTGRLITNYDSIKSPIVSVGDVGYFNNTAKDVAQDQVKTIDEQVSPVIPDEDDIISIAFKKLSSRDLNKPVITIDEIKKNLRPILGDEVDDPSVVEIITKIAFDPRFENAAVVGNAHKDGITIYGAAFSGVEYHEAFHRIFELFVPKAVRDKVYIQISKELGFDLSKDSDENNWFRHRLVAEHVADAYMDYKGREFNTRFNWLNKILNKIRDIVNAYFRISDRQLYKIFYDINSGKYRSERRGKASSEEKERFDRLFKNLHYEVHGEEFKHILNDPMYEDVKNTAFYCMMLGQKIDLSGKSVSDTKIDRKTFMRGADRLLEKGYDIFGATVDPEYKSLGQLAMSEFYVNFDKVSDDIAAMFAQVSTDYKKVRQDETSEDLDGDETSIASAWDENFFKWDYEFSRFDKATSRVKYFFSTIPDVHYDDNGKMVLSLNTLGMPQMMSMHYVYNEVLSQLWDVDTLNELITRTKMLAITDPMWNIISNNIDEIIKTRVRSDGTVDADKEALLTQLMNTIRSNRHTFMIAKAVSNKDGRYSINMQTSDADYNAREFPIQWGQVLSKGGTDILKINKSGQLVFNPKNQEAAIAFKKIARLFDFSRIDGDTEYVGLRQMLFPTQNGKKKIMVLWDVLGTEPYQFIEYSDVELIKQASSSKRQYINRKVTDLNDPKQLKKVKSKIIEALNAIGINIHLEEFDFMLKHKYGSADVDALRQMVSSTDVADSMQSFLYFLNTISDGKSLNVSQDGKIILQNGKRINFEDVYKNLAFVKELGNWKYQYRHAHDELTVLATGGNRFYEMSDNDLFSDTLRDLNKRGRWFEDLKKDPYNYTVGEVDANGESQAFGSYVLDQLTKDSNLKLQLMHFIGFKTDKRGDEGADYFEISRREDYLSKTQILESGGILSLTLSDKKKYVYFAGIKLPGLDYSKTLDSDGNIIPNFDAATQKTHSTNSGGVDQLDSVVTQFLSYAKSEYESIKHSAANNINVANYKENGKRFSSLLGVWETTYDENGKQNKEQFISFNDNTKSWEENLKTAEQYFFNRTEEEQKALIKQILNKRLDKELNTAQELGLIERVDNNENPYFNYKNKGLNDITIQSLKRAYLAKYPECSEQIAESIATVVYLNDISNKAIMSGQEMERLMSGNPAFYKWKYNDRGELIDRTTDELKRLGGLGSTGTNNFLELPNLPEKYKDGKYKCAEVDNEMTASPQLEWFQSAVYEGELRQNIIRDKLNKAESTLTAKYESDVFNINSNKELTELQKQSLVDELRKTFEDDLQATREQIADNIDNETIDNLEREYNDTELLELTREKAQSSAKSLADNIDIADGAAYITDEMCEILLRIDGAWGKEIEEAFDILRGRKKVDYLGQAEAYQKVLTTVIGNQKYTAFGRRLQNGTSIPYYHKMALFPIFECIATGRMSNVFDKMKEQGVDMLLINSAVKVGSEGSKSINWSEYRENDDPSNSNNFYEDSENGVSWKSTFKEAFNFNTYDVDFAYLRKQLNTDPSGEEMLRMGTQAQKIIFSNLFSGRMYTTQTGEQIRGKDLQDRIMQSLNKLSDIGVQTLNRRFFVTDNDGNLIDSDGNIIENQNSPNRQIDIQKFAKEVRRLMSDRGADKNVMKALELVANNADGKRLSMPLSAISSASWLESVLISTINKNVIDVNTPGAFFIQRSVWAMQGQRMYSQDKGNIHGRQLYNGKRLQMVNEEGSMDCVVSLDYYQHMIPKVESNEYELDQDGNYTYKKDKSGKYITDKFGNYIPKRKMRDMSFDEARQWLFDNGVIGDKANIIAYRIPTQAESSIHALRVVDVLPVVRDTVILPEEFTRITGSDRQHQCSNLKKFL